MATASADGSTQTGRIVSSADDAEGVRIALSAAQLAAVLERETLEPGGTVGNRLIGGLRLLGCGVEFVGAGALLAAPEPTMLTKVGGVGLALHASDQCATGARQVWSGRDVRSLTERTATRLALNLGASSEVAGNVGMAVEIMVPIGGAALAGAVRAGVIRAGRISLLRHEAVAGRAGGGHTILKHVGWTETQMRGRIAATATSRRPPPAISTFPDLATAERCVTRVLQVHKEQIATWTRTGARRELTLQLDMRAVIGQGVVRSTGQLTSMTRVRLVVRNETFNGMRYFVLTSHPIP